MARPRKDALYKSLPSSEDGTGVTCISTSGQQYYISQNTKNNKHTLWRITDGNYQRIATGDSPYDLYNQINWE